jgi:hypothetical protein
VVETHHGRPGGRGKELLLLLLTILASIALIGGGFLLGLALAGSVDGGSQSVPAKVGAGVGFLVSAVLWRNLLAHYRYGSDLKPVSKDKDKR